MATGKRKRQRHRSLWVETGVHDTGGASRPFGSWPGPRVLPSAERNTGFLISTRGFTPHLRRSYWAQPLECIWPPHMKVEGQKSDSFEAAAASETTT